MNLRKNIILGFLILLSITLIILIGYGINNMLSKKTFVGFSEIYEKIDNGNVDDISLTIYYMKPSILTTYAVSVEHLINGVPAINNKKKCRCLSIKL